MRKNIIIVAIVSLVASYGLLLSCTQSDAGKSAQSDAGKTAPVKSELLSPIAFDSSAVPNTPFGKAVLYGRELMINTAYYIGPTGVNGRYLRNYMSCSNCHQNGGIKPHSFSLVFSQDEYPQYRAREGKVLSLSDRVNNCINRPMNGKSLPYDSKELLAFLCYLKWINDQWEHDTRFKEKAAAPLQLTDTAASPQRGAVLFEANCSRCHGGEGQGLLNSQGRRYVYPPLWGDSSYQSGSSMHRVIKMAGWLKTNMPYDRVTPNTPFLTDQQALDLAAFVNDDRIHKRPVPKDGKDYPDVLTKPVDYGEGPYFDFFPQVQHKFGPYPPIIRYLKEKGLKPSY